MTVADLCEIEIDAGGYDDLGSYYGVGPSVWTDGDTFVRADDAAEALRLILTA